MPTLRAAAAVIAALMVGASTAAAQRAARDTQTIVFVCEHGTAKSVIALALFQQLARDAHIPYKAVSRGTAPEAALPPGVANGLAADKLTLNHFTPTRFSLQDLVGASLVVSFDQPSVAETVSGRVRTVGWNGLPAVSANYAIARDSIKGRVARLVDSLARTSNRP